MEDTIVIDGKMPRKDRPPFLNRLVSGSAAAAAEEGRSLALVRPRNPRFYYKAKTREQIEKERQAYPEKMGCGAHLRMARPLPQTGEGLGEAVFLDVVYLGGSAVARSRAFKMAL